MSALDLLASLVLEDGRRWGEAADPIQWADARAVLDEASATPYQFLTRARGYSKTTDLAGVALAVMLAHLAPGSRLYALAADRDQGRLLVDSVAGFTARTPNLAGALTVGQYRVTANRTASTLEVVAADAPSSWGLRPHFTIVDELAQWAATAAPRKLWESITSAMAKVPSSRMVVLTSAGDPAHWSHRVLQHARSDRLWRVHEVEGPPPWIDLERLAEQRRRLPESAYRRLFLNEWTSPEDRLVGADDLAACVVLHGPQEPRPGVAYRIGVDLGLRHDRTAIAVCHAEPDDADPRRRRVVLDRLVVLAGTRQHEVSLGAVEEAVHEASRSYNRARVHLDPWQAIGLAQRLRARGVTVVEYPFSSQSVARLASTLHLLLRDRLLSLPDDGELLDELGNVRLRETSPGVLRMDHDSDQHDDRAIALALAATALVKRGADGPASVSSSAGLRMPATPRTRQAPSRSGTVQVGRFVVPRAHYQAPRS